MESAPFAGVVLCCTSIPVDLRTDVAEKVTELGGTHKNDLTHEVTHLIVGDYNTPKYRHVAYERPDIKAMCIGWIDAVRDLWTQDAPIDMAALEADWQMKTFEKHGGFPTGGPDGKPIERGQLLCSVTGFEEEDRQYVISTIVDNGGIYSGDLTRNVTHLIVNKPEGKKYSAALHWGVKAVSIEWLKDCAERGMILDESKYDPRLPPEQRGKGAMRTAAERNAILGKRLRESAAAQAAAAAAENNGQRKLRKTASKKLSVQRDDLWGHILGKPADSASPSPAPESRPGSRTGFKANGETVAEQQQWQPPRQEPQPRQLEPERQPSAPPSRTTTPAPNPPQQNQQNQQQQQQLQHPPLPTAETGGVLSTSIFYIHGFSPERAQVLAGAVATMGGHCAPSLEQMAALAAPNNRHNGYYMPLRQHVIVPQASQPHMHPRAGGDVLFVTEFFIEKCLHKKQYALPPDATNKHPPMDGSIIGMPFTTFPIPKFDTLSICTAGFTGVDLNQVDKTVRQLGAKYEERFTPQCAVLVVTALPAVRKQKLELALSWKVPVVYAKWLWACIASGSFVSVEPYLFPQLRQVLANLNGAAAIASRRGDAHPEPSMALTVPTLVMPSPHTLNTTAPPQPQPQPQPPSAATRKPTLPQNRRHTGFADDDDDDDMDTTAPYETAPTHNGASASSAPVPAAVATAEKTAPSGPPAVRDLGFSSNGRRSMSPPKRDPTPPQQAPATVPQPEHTESATALLKPRPQQPRQPLDRVPSEIADSAAGDSDYQGESGDDERPASNRQRLSRVTSVMSPSKLNRPKSALSAGAGASVATTTTSGLQRSSTVATITATAKPGFPTSSTGTKPPGYNRPPLSRVLSEGLAAAPSVHHPHVPIAISLGDLMKDSGRHTGLRGGGAGGGFSRAYSSVSGVSGPGNDGTVGGGLAGTGAKLGAADGGAGLQPGEDLQSQSMLPPTQVEVQYLDPEADRIREQLMRKIMGGDAAGCDPSSDPVGGGRKENPVPPPSTHGLGTAEESLADVGRSRRRSSRLR
ncbi:brca1 c terminus domain-containing protein [Ophiostoma piceae UAMH 11346]|uniref:Brca1 c terminus domain-containing protein n=1 Tax=Ophiostoma piceae (strain UAMH 11346) TaxID=1262450 RepID=S3BX87_OPHP1|nr:brca1 c terminus domain-containing protein [Ophiostoma piceae UAMH 11346]